MPEPNDSPQDASDQRGPGVWIAAIILIGVGAVYLLQSRGVNIPGNWWALFLLVPAAYSLTGAWKTYERNGRSFSPGMTGPLITAAVLVALTLVFLLGLHVNWSTIWPVLLIVIGLGILGRVYWRK